MNRILNIKRGRQSLVRTTFLIVSILLGVASSAAAAPPDSQPPPSFNPDNIGWDSSAFLDYLLPGYHAQVQLGVSSNSWSLPIPGSRRIQRGCDLRGWVYNDGPDNLPGLDYSIVMEYGTTTTWEHVLTEGTLPVMQAGQTEVFQARFTHQSITDVAGLATGTGRYVIEVEGLTPIVRPVVKDGKVHCPDSPTAPSSRMPK